MIRNIGVLVVVFSFVGVLGWQWAEAQQTEPAPAEKPPTKLTPLMQMKLEKSKLILEGLTMEDFEKIGANARQLKVLSMESGWNVIQTEEYEMQSRDFRRTAELISQAAKEKDINRAALGYVQLTVRCVECHSYMRKHQKGIGVSANEPEGSGS